MTYIPVDRKYGSILVHTNAVETEISGADQISLVQGMSSAGAMLMGFTFSAGSTGAITAFADAGGGKVTVTSNGHGLSNGDYISIHGTTNYNCVHDVVEPYLISSVTINTFDVIVTWVADDATGDWDRGDCLVAGAGVTGTYSITLTASAVSAGANKEFEWHPYINAVPQHNVHMSTKYAGASSILNAANACISAINDGDVLYVGVWGTVDATNVTNKELGLTIHRINK